MKKYYAFVAMGFGRDYYVIQKEGFWGRSDFLITYSTKTWEEACMQIKNNPNAILIYE